MALAATGRRLGSLGTLGSRLLSCAVNDSLSSALNIGQFRCQHAATDSSGDDISVEILLSSVILNLATIHHQQGSSNGAILHLDFPNPNNCGSAIQFLYAAVSYENEITFLFTSEGCENGILDLGTESCGASFTNNEVRPYKTHRIEPPSTTVTTNKEELLYFFTTMYKMRRMEIAADMMYKAKFIRGFCHLYDGQEAVHVGIEAAANFKDSVITSYRDHCTHLGRGGTVLEVMAELMGKTDGASKGVGGSMHMYKKEHNFYGGQGIVGAQVPVGAGLGLAHKYRKDGSVAFALYGDGAANQGQIFEAFNMSALWSLPVIFVCENNHYGMGTADKKSAKSYDYYTRGDYMPGIKVDGMDVLAVKNAVAYAKEYVLENGPIVMEADTYRYHGHSMSDPGSTYRTRDEISSMRQQRDPIEHVRRLLLDNNLLDTAELKKLEKSIKKEIDEAVEKAKAASVPPKEMLWTNTYKDTLGVSTRGIDSKTKVKLL